MVNAISTSRSCQQAMDAMDDMFNKRREVRQKATVRNAGGARPGPKSWICLNLKPPV
jgi:hypothetical protein